MIREFDTLTGPVLLFGGAYSNLPAITALLKEAARLGIPATNIVCTGDIIAYAGDPVQTLEAVIESGMTVVKGNCEESFGNAGDDCGCGFDEGSACDVLSRQWYGFANGLLTPAHRRWMASLPSQVRFRSGGCQIAVIHGGVADISRWIFHSTAPAIKCEEIGVLEQTAPVDIVVAGHCGLPFIDNLGDHLWVNPGVIGMPANDGTPRVWYAVLQAIPDGGVHVSLRPLSYEHDSAARRMKALDLAAAYADTITGGLWPNMDVLPAPERAAVGRAIRGATISWYPGQMVAAE